MTTTTATRRQRRLRGSEDGATAVEAAFVLFVFVGVILTIIAVAQTFFIWNTLQLVVGQASRYVMVQNGIPIPPGSVCDATCAENALQTVISHWLGTSAASICATPTSGQYCVNATCNPSSCTSTPSTPATMKLSALYGFNFIFTYTLAGQITVPIPLPPQ